MTSDELQQQEKLGRKIAAALAPLGLSLAAVQWAAWHSTCRAKPVSAAELRAKGRGRSILHARAAGVAAYFEEHGK